MAIALLMEKINIVPKHDYMHKFSEAEELMEHIDMNDIPYLALAMELRLDGIWTSDRHFEKQTKVKVYSTAELIKLLFD